jgi:uncharacterized protein (UPF0297 family)
MLKIITMVLSGQPNYVKNNNNVLSGQPNYVNE